MTTPGFRPTHVVPQHGMPAWEAPDPARPTVDLDPLLPVQLLERQGDWGHVLCFNGWSAWVDGRRLVAVPLDPPAADGPLTRAADPRPLLGRAQEALARYRSAVEDLAGGLDRESFRSRTHGMRIGVVIDGESVWLYDSAHGHWVYADGSRMTTYATDETPAADPESRPAETPVHPPTRVVPPEGPGDTPRTPEAPRPADTPPPARSAPAGPTRVVPPEASGPTGAAPPEAPEPSGPAPPETPEPERIVPAAPEPTRVVAPGAPEPTRVVSPEAPEPQGGVSPDAPEPTRVVAPEAPEPTRVVSPDAPEPERAAPSEAPEPTRVAAPDAPEPTRVAAPDAPEPTRVVAPEAPEPTRVVSPDAPEPERAAPSEAPEPT
ncbi:hypothetical protein ACGF8D_22945, partial [Streptomyces massasporeus]|uniref:hypothetical protein n=1 Tax=Streptomyces massasporeus TaxID=67324 RepID=UPI003710BB46